MTNEFSSLDASHLTGISLRKLQWWDEHGILKPATKHAHRRRYTFLQLVTISVIRELLAKGITLAMIRRAQRRSRTSLERKIVTLFRGPNVEDSPLFESQGAEVSSVFVIATLDGYLGIVSGPERQALVTILECGAPLVVVSLVGIVLDLDERCFDRRHS